MKHSAGITTLAVLLLCALPSLAAVNVRRDSTFVAATDPGFEQTSANFANNAQRGCPISGFTLPSTPSANDVNPNTPLHDPLIDPIRTLASQRSAALAGSPRSPRLAGNPGSFELAFGQMTMAEMLPEATMTATVNDLPLAEAQLHDSEAAPGKPQPVIITVTTTLTKALRQPSPTVAQSLPADTSGPPVLCRDATLDPNHVIITSPKVPFRHAEAVCATQNMTLGLADVSIANFIAVTNLAFKCYGPRAAGWVRSYNGVSHNNSCLALFVGDAAPGGSINIPDSCDLELPTLCRVAGHVTAVSEPTPIPII